MAVVTISRGSYSRGKEVAERLAEKLGYACISRDILLDASVEFNIPEIKLIRALHDSPSVLDRFQHGKERYLSYLRSALLQHIKKDNVVYHGLAGHYFLRGIPHVLKVRIIADMEARVREEMMREGISEEKARYILNKDDEERRKWGIQVYGMDPWDSRLYDMVLNLKILTVDDAIQILYDTVQKPIFRATPESQRLVEDMALSAKVQAKLVKTLAKVKVEAREGHVFITSTVEATSADSSILEEIKAIADGIEGVRDVFVNIHGGAMPPHTHVNPFHKIGH
jgi:cytidylate kinase